MPITEFTRDRLHHETGRTMGKLSAHLQYDRLGRVSKRAVFKTPYPAPPVQEQSWQYDLRHNLTREQQATAPYAWRHYDYDAADRLQQRESNAFSPETWHYDLASNLLDTPSSGHWQHNQLKQYQGIRYQYRAPRDYPESEVTVPIVTSETRFIWEGLRLLAEERDGCRWSTSMKTRRAMRHWPG
ncbi:hypothetical protein LZ683_13145 [Comamonas testosteroni]|uniref:hypothetical protein n=1 Tax=Comamonas testosteroni TaxID=285 RepID=UPI0023AA8453|nr:hypothetical protein [Comamonas testosteroni]WEE80224.1 hypothetical protein LZ683_13145 [Comamonas testosteroni]